MDKYSDVVFFDDCGKSLSVSNFYDIISYLNEWAEQECLPRQVRNLICTTARIVGADLENLGEVDLDFSNYTKESQIFYFGEHS